MSDENEQTNTELDYAKAVFSLRLTSSTRREERTKRLKSEVLKGVVSKGSDELRRRAKTS